MKPGIEGLYAITLETTDSGLLKAQVAAALRGGVRLVQYRNKHGAPALRRAQAGALAELARACGAMLIVNDSPELAAACAADGVHIGREDADVASARRHLGRDKIIGVSCYDDFGRALAASRAGADYVAFGSFFPSRTKPDAVRAPLDLLRRAKSSGLGVPVVAIGGIDATNAGQLIRAGADAIAVGSALFASDDIEASARALARQFAVV